VTAYRALSRRLGCHPAAAALAVRTQTGLDSALSGVLSGADLTFARAYLRGYQVAGAAAELEASTHWYNDEEERIEEVMFNFKPEELERLKSSKEGRGDARRRARQHRPEGVRRARRRQPGSRLRVPDEGQGRRRA